MRTLGLTALALQAPGASPAAGGTGDILGLIARSGPASKAVLLILVLFSISSWTITFYKWWQFRRADRQTTSFLEVFRRSNKFSEVQAVCRTLGDSPLVGIFQAGYAELNTQLRQTAPGSTPEARPTPLAPRPTLRSLDSLDRALLRAQTVEVNKLENRVTFLATTANITPFIGLFGTVWGIMNAFIEIGATGSTELAAVGPGIAEALIATAAGLFAAIPAVYFYNHFTQHLKQFVSSMDDFSLEFLNIAERNFT